MTSQAPFRLSMLLAAGALALAGPARAEDISRAEQLVFMGDHLSALHPPLSLNYGLEETGPGAHAKPERLRLSLKARDDGGCCAVTAEEEGGTSFGFLAPVDNAKANPVILYFLERDIRQMQAQTGGQSNYFRRLIRLSLVDQATVAETTVRYGGRDVPAEEVRVVPYAHDAHVAAFGPLAQKAYTFVLAKDVPGGVFQIKTAVAPPGGETVLTLTDSAAARSNGGQVQSGK
jgi:hypothetical protein